MGVLNNKIEIDKLKKNGGGSGELETRVANLENGLEQTDVEVANIYGRFNYSTYEKLVGEWIDGKDLYCKVIVHGPLTGSTSYDETIELDNNINVLDYDGLITNNYNKQTRKVISSGSNYSSTIVTVGTGNLNWKYNTDASNISYTLSLKLYYTKNEE